MTKLAFIIKLVRRPCNGKSAICFYHVKAYSFICITLFLRADKICNSFMISVCTVTFPSFSVTDCKMAESVKHSTSALLSPFFIAANNLFIVAFTESSADWAFALKAIKRNKR